MCQDPSLTSKPWEDITFGPDPPYMEGKRGCEQVRTSRILTRFQILDGENRIPSLPLKGTCLVYSNLRAKYGGWNCMSNVEAELMKVCPSSVFFFFLLYYLTDRWENIKKQGSSIAYSALLVCTAFSLGKYLRTLITSPLNLSFYDKLNRLKCSWVRTFFQAFK